MLFYILRNNPCVFILVLNASSVSFQEHSASIHNTKLLEELDVTVIHDM
jgi:hypothetical protein